MTVLEATVRLTENPRGRSLLVLGFPDIYRAADAVPDVLATGPIACEGMDGKLIDDMLRKGLNVDSIRRLPEGRGWLVVEYGGSDRIESDTKVRAAMRRLGGGPGAPEMRSFDRRDTEIGVWGMRESAVGATAMVPGRPWTGPGWEDSAVRPERLGAYLRELRKLWDGYGYDADMYGHFGDGCLHCRINFDLETADGVRAFRRYLDEAADLVVGFGGSLSGEHGDGQARGELLPRMFGGRLVGAFEEFKDLWDPDGRMNPGKVVRAMPVDADLRVAPGVGLAGRRRAGGSAAASGRAAAPAASGRAAAPAASASGSEAWSGAGRAAAPGVGVGAHGPEPRLQFAFEADDGSFAHAAFRCIGVGKCRRGEGGVMCPSYMVTREERHSTRGRARLLYEMLNGDELIGDGWRSREVREALDLCFACKGCKTECPVGVDMATYKAEFLSHYYAGRPRPMAAYSMGLIYWWARLASRMPRLVNGVTHAPITGPLAKRIGGIAPERDFPRFADRTFKQWFEARGQGAAGGEHGGRPGSPAAGGEHGGRPGSPAAGMRPEVILWPDTFNNHFRPTTSRSAVEVLEGAGFRVTVPKASLCCGRPLYDWGMLDLAKRLLRQVLRELREPIARGVPIVGLEPSCVSVFRDELVGLFPGRADARRLSGQVFLLSEFLAEHAPGYEPPGLAGHAMVQGHCHQQSILGMDSETRLLGRMGLDVDVLGGGCCGMAGAFGFQRGEHYEVSVAAGERSLLPAVRAASAGTLVVADGFSCREQIEQGTGRQTLHLAQVLAMAHRQSG